MRKKHLARMFGASLLMITAAVAQDRSGTRFGQLGSSQSRQVSPAYGNLPMTFEANQGQTDAQTKFVARGKDYSAFLTAGGMVLSLHPGKIVHPQQDSQTEHAQGPSPLLKTTLQFNLLGSTQNPTVVGEDQQPGRVNYFIGRDPKRWRTNVPTYARVRYKNVYPGIDLVYYGNPRQLEYDFEITAGGNPNVIQFEIKGANQLQLDADGDLVLKMNDGELHFQSPVVYQQSKGQRLAVDGGYVMKDATHIGFRVAQYDPAKPLVIDPTLVYSTYLGGSGDYNTDAIAIDNTGSIYVTGETDTADFPVTGSGLLGTFGTLGPHAYIAKLDPTGSTLVYADYLGGSSEDCGYALTVDSANELYITGNTNSNDFPLVSPFQATMSGGFTTFVTKISADGASIAYSTYLGGNGIFDWPSGIALDSAGGILVAGMTMATNFPLANAFQSTVSANQGGVYGVYGFLAKFTPDGSSLVYSTYLGGSSNAIQTCYNVPCWLPPDCAMGGLAVDASGNAYVAGGTNTSDFPVTAGAYLTTDSNVAVAVGFVSKFNATGGLVYSTYLYGNGGLYSSIRAIAVDSSGSAYVAGFAISDVTFPITSTNICDPGVYGAMCSFSFVTKLDPTGSSLLYSTFLGPNNLSTPQAIALDASNNAYVVGYSLYCPQFATVNSIESCEGDYNVVLVEIDPTGSAALFTTYLGGGAWGTVPYGLALDSSGNMYVGGITSSVDFPTTPGAYQTALPGNHSPFVLKIAPDPAPAFSASPYLLQYAAQQVGSTSGATPILLRNMGSASLSISSITVSGDFAETNDCENTVPAAGSCTFSVTFLPTAAGPRSGSIMIKDNASGSPHFISLIGNSPGGVLALTPAGLAFPGQELRSSSVAQTVTLGNNGNTPLKLDRIQASGDFAQTNNCPTTMPAASSCAIQVTFTPTVLGARSGTLTIGDNVQVPKSVNLSGAGSDFILVSSTKNETVRAGDTATYHLTIAPLGGSFSNAVNLICSELPAHATCSLAPNVVTPGGSGATATVTVTTLASVAATQPIRLFDKGRHYAIWIPLQGMGLFGLILVERRRVSKKRRLLTVLCLIIVTLVLMTACAGGTGIVPQPRPGTPVGTYKVLVTGNSGTQQHSASLTLIVQ